MTDFLMPVKWRAVGDKHILSVGATDVPLDIGCVERDAIGNWVAYVRITEDVSITVEQPQSLEEAKKVVQKFLTQEKR